MKGISSKISKGITIGTQLVCSDNSGAKIIEVISIPRIKGTRKRILSAGVANLVIASVKKGKPEMVKKVVKAVIIRQKKPFRRANGMRIVFEDNAAVLVNDDFLALGTEIKGCVAKEVAERFPKLAAVSSSVV